MRPSARGTNPEQRARWLVWAKEVVAFGIVGAVNFGIDLAVYQLGYTVLHLGALVAKAVSTTITATLAYFMHRYFSFRHRAWGDRRREFVAFVVLSAASLLLGFAIIGAVRYGLGRTDILALQIANVTSILVGAAVRFFAYKRWVFRAATPAAVTHPEPPSYAAPARVQR